MKKITIFSLSFCVGGIEQYIATLSNMFANDYEVEIICTYKISEEIPFYISPKVNITYLVEGDLYKISTKELLRSKKVISFLKEIIRRKKLKRKAYNENKKIIKKLNCDYVISTRMYHSKLINRYLPTDTSIVTIATEHNYLVNDAKYVKALVSSLTRFNYFVVATKAMCDFYTPFMRKTECLQIPNSVDVSSSVKTKLSNKNILYVGRFSEEKGVIDLLNVFALAIKKDPEIRLNLVGDGYLRKELVDKAKDLNIFKYIKMPGFLEKEKLRDYYLDSSLYVMTSFTEAFGLVLLEAMNYGLPCIAFDSASGAKELLANNVGCLISDRNLELMADTIVNLLNDKERLEQYVKNESKVVIKCSTGNVYELWKKIL